MFALWTKRWCTSECVKPIIANIFEICKKVNIWGFCRLSIVSQSRFSNIKFVFMLTVWAEEKADCGEKQTKQSSHITENTVNFSKSPWNLKYPCWSVNIEVYKTSVCQRDSIRSEMFYINSWLFLIVAKRKKTFISKDIEFSHINVSYSSYSLGKCQEDILF